MAKKAARQTNFPTQAMKLACPVCDNVIELNLGMLIVEALEKFGPLSQSELERITKYMAHFRHCLGSEYQEAL